MVRNISRYRIRTLTRHVVFCSKKRKKKKKKNLLREEEEGEASGCCVGRVCVLAINQEGEK